MCDVPGLQRVKYAITTQDVAASCVYIRARYRNRTNPFCPSGRLGTRYCRETSVNLLLDVAFVRPSVRRASGLADLLCGPRIDLPLFIGVQLTRE